MSNGKTHAFAGALAGAGSAAYAARNEDRFVFALETIAGLVGGVHGARAPDYLEPATTPNHRAFMHSVVVGASGTAAIVKRGSVPLNWARARILELEAKLQSETDPLRRLALQLGVVGLHIAIGYGVGFAAGYGSHLVLDAATPGSLPLLTNGSRED